MHALTIAAFISLLLMVALVAAICLGEKPNNKIGEDDDYYVPPAKKRRKS